MKLKGIWVAIGLIVIGGLWTTSMTKEYARQMPEAVASREDLVSPEEPSMQSGERSQSAGAQAATAQAATAQTKATVPGAGAAPAEASDVMGAAEAAPVEAVPLQEAAPAPPGLARIISADSDSQEESADSRDAAAQVLARLQDLDEQIEKSHTGQSRDSTTNAMKATAETERKLWETELERFIGILEKTLPQEEKDALFLEQKEWIRDREAEAVALSKKQSGTSLMELEYNLALKEITRDRVYELARRYGQLLAEG